MKNLVLISLAACTGFFSCTKSNTPAPAAPIAASPTLVGAWRVISDTTHSNWIANVGNPTGAYVSVYTGTSSDQYTFTADGAYSAQFKNGTSSGAYTLTNNELMLVNTAVQQYNNTSAFTVSKLTDHAAVLVHSLASPGGAITEIITLAK